MLYVYIHIKVHCHVYDTGTHDGLRRLYDFPCLVLDVMQLCNIIISLIRLKHSFSWVGIPSFISSHVSSSTLTDFIPLYHNSHEHTVEKILISHLQIETRLFIQTLRKHLKLLGLKQRHCCTLLVFVMFNTLLMVMFYTCVVFTSSSDN